MSMSSGLPFQTEEENVSRTAHPSVVTGEIGRFPGGAWTQLMRKQQQKKGPPWGQAWPLVVSCSSHVGWVLLTRPVCELK